MFNFNFFENLKIKFHLGKKKNESTAIKADQGSNVKMDSCIVDGFDNVADVDNQSEAEIKDTIMRK